MIIHSQLFIIKISITFKFLAKLSRRILLILIFILIKKILQK